MISPVACWPARLDDYCRIDYCDPCPCPPKSGERAARCTLPATTFVPLLQNYYANLLACLISLPGFSAPVPVMVQVPEPASPTPPSPVDPQPSKGMRSPDDSAGTANIPGILSLLAFAGQRVAAETPSAGQVALYLRAYHEPLPPPLSGPARVSRIM